MPELPGYLDPRWTSLRLYDERERCEPFVPAPAFWLFPPETIRDLRKLADDKSAERAGAAAGDSLDQIEQRKIAASLDRKFRDADNRARDAASSASPPSSAGLTDANPPMSRPGAPPARGRALRRRPSSSFEQSSFLADPDIGEILPGRK